MTILAEACRERVVRTYNAKVFQGNFELAPHAIVLFPVITNQWVDS